jgi:thiamine biosynthesis lipoprotein
MAWRFKIMLLAAVLLSACYQPRQDFRQQWFIFGTQVSVELFAVNRAKAHTAFSRLDELFAQCNEDWYPWATASGPATGELARINRAIAGGTRILASQETAAVIRRAEEFERLSQGLFNPALGALSELWGFADMGRPWAGPPSSNAVAELLAKAPSTSSIHWENDVLSSDNPAIVMDLGGIAKGAILDRARRLLIGLGVRNAVIDLGGDLVVLGKKRGKPVRVGIRGPVGDMRRLGILGGSELSGGEAAVTSGDYERFFTRNGQRYQHILDPRTGQPVKDTALVTVISEDPLLADAAATALLVGGARQFDTLVEALGVRDALLITAGGERIMTPAMQKRIRFTDAN